LTRKPSIFYSEKRVLTMFPYWLVVSILIGLTVLSCLPLRVSSQVLQSSISRRMIRLVMRSRGLAR